MNQSFASCARAFWLVASMCVLFTAAASAGAIFLTAWHGETPGPVFLLRTALKGAAFLALSFGALWGLGRDIRAHRTPLETRILPPEKNAHILLLLPILLAALFTAFARTEDYPAIQPDESYHMTVARNLAVHGKYASGSPQEGFVVFDDYDSVGAPVILPVAAAFKIMGTSISAGRFASGAYFIALCIAVFAFVRKPFGTARALASTFFLCFALMTPYLARTLYGEVPALFWLVEGLVLWRMSYERTGAGVAYSVLAGVCFGLAVLTKEIAIFVAWPYAMAVALDRMTHRRMKLPEIIVPPFVAASTIGLVAIVRYLYHTQSASAVGALDTYRHHLLFGFHGLPATSSWLWQHALILVPPAIALCVVLAGLMRRRYDPAMLVLVLTACLFLYWWTFFTPGHIPRYLWYTCAIMGICAGPVFVDLFAGLRVSARPPYQKALAAVAVCAFTASQIPETASEFRAVLAKNETHHERALAAKLLKLPPGANIATTDWRLKRTMNLLADRSVKVVNRPEDAPLDAYLIVNLDLTPSINESDPPCATFGPYEVFCPQ